MKKQEVLNVLNSLEVVDSQGGEDAYMTVDNNEEVRQKLSAVGIDAETIRKYGDDESFCVLALAFSEGYADAYSVEKGLYIWEPLVDDELRYRVLNGEGTATDAERLLKALEPALFTA